MTRFKFHRRSVVPAGSPPGTLAVTGGTSKPVLHLISYDAEAIEEVSGEDAGPLCSAVRPDRVSWMDVHGLGDQDVIRVLGETFGLHPLALADVVNLGQRPKAEDYGELMFFVLRMVTLDDELRLQWEQVSMFLGPNFVLTFQETPGDCLDGLRTRLRQGKRQIRCEGPGYLATMVIDAIVDGYFPVIEAFGDELEDLEKRVIRDPARGVLLDVYRAKRELLKFRQATWPLRDMLSHVLRGPPTSIAESTLPYLRDAEDHAMQVVEITESYRELLGSFVDIYLSSISNRTNEVMRVLTVLATIFIPLTFLTGVYGMNFDTRSPYNMPELGWRFGYVAFLGSCFVLALGLLWMFWRLGWLRGIRASAQDDGSS